MAMLRSTSTDKENLSIQVATPVTPARRPLARVQDTCLRATPTKSLKKKFGIFSTRLVQQKKRKADRYSVPAYVLRTVSPSDIPSSAKDATIKEKVSAVKDEESLYHKDVSQFVQKVVKGIVNELKVQRDPTYLAAKNNKGYEDIILQMNKERLLLEKQLIDALKVNRLVPVNVENMGRAKMDNKGKHVRLELEEKTKEIKCLKQQLCQAQKLVLEIPTLKNDLQKSKQEYKSLSGMVFSCRKENTNQKEAISKLHKELEEHAAAFRIEHNAVVGKLTLELEQKESECMQLGQVISQHEEDAAHNHHQCQILSGTVDRLESLSSMAEAYKKMAEDRVWTLQQQVEDLIKSQQASLNELDESKRELHELGTHAKQAEEETLALKEKATSLEDDKDLGRLEIIRQQGLIRQQEKEIENLKAAVDECQNQMEILQTQQQEMNEFVEEERRNLEETTHEMERQLKISTEETSLVGLSLKEKSFKYEILTGEVLQSRSLLHEKQEELDATQSQAHWVLFQQESEMAEAASQLREAWELVSTMLETFSKQAGLRMVPEESRDASDHRHTSTSEHVEAAEAGSDKFAPVSLVQSVLAAVTANRSDEMNAPSEMKLDNRTEDLPANCSNVSDLDEDSPLTISEQACELKRALERLREIGSGEAANHGAKVEIQRLKEERNSIEEQYKSSLDRKREELDESRASETKLRRELGRKSSEVTSLHAELRENRDNLQLAFVKLDALSEECSRQIEKESDMKELAADFKSAQEELKKLKDENEILSAQLQQTLRKMDNLSETSGLPDAQKTTDNMLGEVMAEKFSFEKKFKQVKKKSLFQRLEYEDCMAEYKYRSETKIKVLESNVEKAESEIYRLDEVLERIRVVLQENPHVASQSPELQHLLHFLNGGT